MNTQKNKQTLEYIGKAFCQPKHHTNKISTTNDDYQQKVMCTKVPRNNLEARDKLEQVWCSKKAKQKLQNTRIRPREADYIQQ